MFKKTLQDALIIPRIKAFITDLFMIYTPILYLMTYLVLDGPRDFQNNQKAIFLCIFLYGIISASFLSSKAQTPGFKFIQIKLTHQNKNHVSFFNAFLRFILWLFSMAFVIGFIFPFLNKKHQCLHDFICKTNVVLSTDNTKNINKK